MELIDIVMIAVIAAMIGLAAWYVYKAKKSGRKCIGCPDGGSCSGGCSGGCSACNCGCGGASKGK